MYLVSSLGSGIIFKKKKKNHLLQLRTLNVYLLQHTFLGEILGAVVLADDHSFLNATFKSKPIKLYATGDESMDGQLAIDEKQGKLVKLLRRVNPKAYYDLLANRLGDKKQSAVIASFEEQKRIWTTPPNRTETSS